MLTRACELYVVNQVRHDKIEYKVQTKNVHWNLLTFALMQKLQKIKPAPLKRSNMNLFSKRKELTTFRQLFFCTKISFIRHSFYR